IHERGRAGGCDLRLPDAPQRRSEALRVDKDGRRHPCTRTPRPRSSRSHSRRVPTVRVGTLDWHLSNNADLLIRVLLNISADQLVVAAHVERTAPRIAQTISPDFGQRIITANEGIIGWDGVVAVDVDSQNLPVRR